MNAQTEVAQFGTELKRWRQHRRYSQLELASRAEVSQRHLSFLETGRSKPSPEMIQHLSMALAVPLRARNALLHLAGFAPIYSEESLHSPALAQVRQSLEILVEAHNPFPAYVVDRSWNLVLANTTALVLTGLLLPSEAGLELAGNVLRMFLHPDGARATVANWPQAAAVLIDRLVAECDANPTDSEIAQLLREVSDYPGVAEAISKPSRTSTSFLTSIHVHTDQVDLQLYTAISSLAAPSDVTLEELRLETLLPADQATADELRRLCSEVG
jgi:transcriptional regulator with XRE-family HTH domain